MPFNDQLAVGRPRWLRAYATAYSHCASSAPRARYGKAVPIGDHFCGKLERSLVPAIRSRVPDDKFRRFWFQYWIVRGYQIPYFEEHHDFAYRTWGSPCCWQRLNWAQPAMSLSVLVDLNTTCLVDPNVLGKHDKNSVRWPRGGSVDLLKCRFAGSYCDFKKYPSSCKDAKGPPPGPDHYLPEELPVGAYEAPREAAYDDGPRSGGGSWRCAKQMKIAVLGGSMACGGNLAKRHNDKTKAWPARLLSKLRSSLGAGVTLHNACEPASSLGWCVSLLSTHVPPGTDVVVVDYSQNDNRPTIEDAREGGAAVDELDHDGLWPASELLGNARLDGLWRAPAARAATSTTTRACPRTSSSPTRRARRSRSSGAERGDGAVVPDWAPAGGTLASANEPAELSACSLGMAAHHVAADAERGEPGRRGPRAAAGPRAHPARGRGDGAVVPDWAPAGGTLASANELAELSACSLGMARTSSPPTLRPRRARRPGPVSAVDTVALNATWPQAESLAVVRQFKVACQNYAMMWNPVVVKLRPDPGDRGKFKLLSVFAC
ncbi:hypothetical protein JL722_15062 [Aureococcus anophagefferens]|nr:hypothetical protein JL722_15062 [Aureococcus anophagefferens]